MEIDKQNGNVAFNDAAHVYWDVNDNAKKYISVTTLIGRYEQPYDQDFWSAYKTFEKLIPQDEWTIIAKDLRDKKKINKEELFQMYNIDENNFNKMQQDLLDEWARNNREACERGTQIHAALEQSFYDSADNVQLNKFGIGGKFQCKRDYNELDLPYGVYPEYLISRTSDDGILNIAGQIDLLVKNGNEITIIDHKTNKKLRMKSFFDSSTKSTTKMKYPLNKLDDCNFIHYTLQLSMYAWMLQKINPDFVIKDLILNYYDHEGNNKLYHCDYLKNEVEHLLIHYKKELIKEAQRAKFKRVEY